MTSTKLLYSPVALLPLSPCASSCRLTTVQHSLYAPTNGARRNGTERCGTGRSETERDGARRSETYTYGELIMSTKSTSSGSSGSTPSDLLTTLEAARYLRLSHRTLERYRVTGEGPIYRKLGSRVLYRRSDLDAWRDARKRRSTSDPGPSSTPPTRSSKSKPKRRNKRRNRPGPKRPPPTP